MSPLTPSMFYSMTRQLIIYSLIMTVNIILLWTTGFSSNYLLTILVIVSIFTIVPAIFTSYLILYIYYNFLDVFTSNSIHVVFLQSEHEEEIQFTNLRAENEDVSDTEHYKENYPENIVDINPADLSETEQISVRMTRGLKKKIIFPFHKNKGSNYENEDVVTGNWINTHISI